MFKGKNKNKIEESTAGKLFDVFLVLFFIAIIILMIIPIFKVLSDSLDESVNYGINLIPKKFSINAYKTIIDNVGMRRPFLISIYTTFMGTFLGLFVCCVGAYVLLQKNMPGRNFLVGFVMFTMIFHGGLVPTYLVLRYAHLTNTLWAVILPLSLNVYNMVLMKSFFEQIPTSLFESADIDGATPFQIFLRIVLPLSKPALATIGLFFAVTFWNEFFSFVMYITDTSKYNFQVKLRELVLDSQNLNSADVIVNLKTMQNAAIVVAMAPFLVIYPFCQRYFVAGLTMGAVKE